MTESILRVSSAAVSDKGLSEKRPQNEDSFLRLENSGLFAVADGVGGAQAGDVASEMAVEILGEAFINLDAGGDAEDRMRLAIDKANASIYQMSRDLPQLSTMATTLVAVHISGNIATIGHVGDSRLYRLDSGGLLFRETQDHSVVEEEVRAGRMTREQAATHPSRNVISRALGAEETVEIDMKTIMFETNSAFLVCSDGVTRHIPDEEIRDLLYLNDDPDEICVVIKKLCFERGAEDNLTAVVIKTVGVPRGATDVIPVAEEETETVATARAGISSGQVFADIPEKRDLHAGTVDPEFELDDLDDLEDISDLDEEVEQVEIVEKVEPIKLDQLDDLEEVEEISIPTRGEFSVSSPDVAEQVNEAEEAEVADFEEVKDVRAYRVDENTGSGFLGQVFSGVVWLLVGLLIGALGYFLLSTAFEGADDGTAAPPDQPVRAFEQQRRLVDSDPAKYIAAYSTKDEKTAGDHYLVGRAYIIQGNYGAAKTSFENALKLLDAEDAANRAVLEHDIAAGLAIANIKEAQESFESGPGKPEESNGETTTSPQGD